MSNLLHILTLASVVGYVALAVVPLVITANVREGPSYWPAFTFVALASGLPGVYFALTVALRLGGYIPAVPDLPQRVTTIAVLGVALLLQGGALRQVRRENARWRRDGSFQRRRRGVHQVAIGQQGALDDNLTRMEAREADADTDAGGQR